MTCQQTVGGFKCEKGKEIAFNSPVDAANPLVSHNWTLDGVQESTTASYVKTFATTGTHTLTHTGTNSCGSTCSQPYTLEIADVIIPPTPSGGTQKSSIAPLLIGATFLGLIALVAFKK